eukprot:scaffold182306_cov18-Tisochrysis_lutea.AAC.1
MDLNTHVLETSQPRTLQEAALFAGLRPRFRLQMNTKLTRGSNKQTAQPNTYSLNQCKNLAVRATGGQLKQFRKRRIL